MGRWETWAAVLVLCGGTWLTTAKGSDLLAVSERARIVQPFDADWRFHKGDVPGAEATAADDSAWRSLDVPHDWSIEGPIDQNNPAGGAGAFFPTGVGWYRKHFTLPTEDAQRKAFIEFDGVMANSDVWINGFLLGKRPYGYASFRYEMTGHLNFGSDKPNVLVVRADTADQPASRWYAGSGIYRHVRLVLTSPLYLDQWGTFVTTPQVTKTDATVHVRNTVINHGSAEKNFSIEVTLIDPEGQTAGKVLSRSVALRVNESIDVDQDLQVQPKLWQLDTPNMYHAITRLREGDSVVDDDVTPFGIRSAEFKADTGFWLNGQNIKIKGVCLHGDMDGFGTAVPLGAWEHRLTALKSLGCNAIRTSHNPVAPEFLDLCDRMGFLVMDEFFDCWTVGKNRYDYHILFRDWSTIDARDSVRRDRNHPCIVLYSAGNEIHDTPHPDIAVPILKSLIQVYHRNDPSRPVTQALFRPNSSHDFDDGLAALLDVVGVNYRDAELLAAHAAVPTRKIIGTENGKDLKPWLAVRDNAAYAGQFLWSGTDYLGEARAWPAISRDTGLLDLSDQPHAAGLQRKSWWTDQPMVAIVRDQGTVFTGNIPGEPQTRMRIAEDWTPVGDDKKAQKVFAFSNADEVELSLNGKSLGSLKRPADGAQRVWTVVYAPGSITAVARNRGKEVAKDELRTAGKAAKIVLKTDHDQLSPTWDDVSFITATIVDEAGTVVPSASDQITFAVDGPGKVAVVENGDTNGHEPFQASQRHAFQGICTAVIRAISADGKIHLTATAPGLASGSIELEAVDASHL